MSFVKAITNALLVVLLLKMTFVWAWPPTEEDKEKWRKIIQDGSTRELRDYVDKLKSQNEDINQWFLIDTDNKDHMYRSLVRASEVGEPDSVQRLIDSGAELQRYIEKSDTSQMTPLVAACQEGRIGVVRVLLAAGADVNAPVWLFTPEYSIIRSFQIVTARRLIEAGESPEQLGWKWPDPNRYTSEQDLFLFAILQSLARRNIEENPQLWSPNSRNVILGELANSEVVKKLAEVKNEQRLIQSSPLNVAAVYGHIDIAAELIKRGADASGVEAIGRATLQQIYPPGKGISENFLQFHVPAYWGNFTPQLQKMLNELILAALQPSTIPLLNQGVLLMTLDIPAHVELVDRTGNRVTRIEHFILVPDLIKTGDHAERAKSVSHIILLTSTIPSQRTPWVEPQTTKDQVNMFDLMELAKPLGTKTDEVGFYQDAHRELILENYKEEPGGVQYHKRKSARGSIQYSGGWDAPVYTWNGKSGFITSSFQEAMDRAMAELNKIDGAHMKKAGEVTSRTPLKQYWENREVASEPVVIENTAQLRWMLLGWDQQPLPYDMSIWDFVMEQLLDWHRPQLTRLMHAALEDHPELKQKALEKGINLYCLGCGGGEDVRVFHRSIQDQGYDVHVTGIEQSGLLCRNGASECYSIRETTRFLNADAHDAARVIRESRQKTEGITIVVAEDFLVQQVLPGPYSGLKILHQLIQPGVADMVVIGGVHHPLVNERIASAAGWSVQEVPIYHSYSITLYLVRPELNKGTSVSTPAFVLTRPSQDSEWNRLIHRCLHRSTKISTDGRYFQSNQFIRTLDLSMSGLPNKGLKLFLDKKKVQDITQVDLSYTYLDENQLDETINLLPGFPNLVHVMVSGFEPWYEAFLKAVKMTGRFKLVLRKDNQYRHELPAVDPDTAKLLGQFKTMPNERVFVPPRQAIYSEILDAPAWTTDIDSGYLTPGLLSAYRRRLLEILTRHNIQLQETPGDGLCFFHAIAQQLHIHEEDLRAALYNHMIANGEEIQTQFPQFAGEAFIELLLELSQGAWGDAGQAQLTAWVFNKRVILFYFNSQTGAVLIQILNPDGTVTQPNIIPPDISQNDIILIHNGQGHWLAGGNTQTAVDLYQENAHLLPTQKPIPSLEHSLQKLLTKSEQRYSPEIFPKLIALLITAWQLKFR